MIAEILTGLIFIASAIPLFWIAVPIGSFLRFDVWYATLAVFFVVTLPARRKGAERASRGA